MNKIVKKGFTLVELLVVISIIAMLLSILMPSLSKAREQAMEVICRSNIRQLYIANTGYANENSQYYVPAAEDIFTGFGLGGGKKRWHGERISDTAVDDPELNKFDASKGPLAGYLADGQVKKCPGFKQYDFEDADSTAFEASCGGFGYNSAGIGSRSYIYGYCDKAMRSSMKSTEINKPFMKVMFTDTAFLVSTFDDKYLIEYSFCEPPKNIIMHNGSIIEYTKPSPTINFRHDGSANVVYADGHIDAQKMEHSKYSDEITKEYPLGWFGPRDNLLFRPF